MDLAATVIKRGTILAGPLHFNKRVPTLNKGWGEHTHLLYHLWDASSATQGAPFTLTSVTGSSERPKPTRIGKRPSPGTGGYQGTLPIKVQLFIQLYPEQDESWGHVGDYYLADLDNQSGFWNIDYAIITLFCLNVRFRVEDTEPLDLGLGDKINFGVFGEQHLSTCSSLT